MSDAFKLSIGAGGTVAAWLGEQLDAIGPHAGTLSALATVAFLAVCIAEKFGLLDRFRRRNKTKTKD